MSRILIGDDDRELCALLSEYLRREGLQVEVVHDGEAVLTQLRDPALRPDLLILDVMLPSMNGIDLAMALKERFPDCRILLMSGQPSVESLLQEARGKGHEFEILAKPVHPTEILDTIAGLFSANGCEHCSQD